MCIQPGSAISPATGAYDTKNALAKSTARASRIAEGEAEAFVDVVVPEGVEELLQVAVYDAVEGVERKADPVVGHAVLGKVVRAYLLGPVAAAAQRKARGADLCLLLAALQVEYARLQRRKALLAVPDLRALVLADGDEPRRDVRHPHRALRLVDVLPACAACAEEVDPYVLLGYVDVVGVVGLGEHYDRRGGGVDAPLSLRLGNALHTVRARLEAERSVGILARHGEHDLLIAVERRLVRVHDGDLHALRLAVAGVHPEEVAREERGLLAARPGADLHHGVAPVERIGRQKRRGKLALRRLAELPRDVCVVELLEKAVVGENLAVARAVVENIRVAQLRFNGLEATQNLLDLDLIDQGLLLRELRVALPERIDAAFRVDHRLGAGEVRVARGAGVDRHFLLRGTCVDDVAARACDRGVVVLRMDVTLHFSSFPFEIECVL